MYNLQEYRQQFIVCSVIQIQIFLAINWLLLLRSVSQIANGLCEHVIVDFVALFCSEFCTNGSGSGTNRSIIFLLLLLFSKKIIQEAASQTVEHNLRHFLTLGNDRVS